MRKYMDRDISWIRFNNEVLEETTRKIPMAEQVLFFGITGSNLDEFCQVRYPAQVDMDTDEELEEFRTALKKHYGNYMNSWRKFNKEHGLIRKVKDLKDGAAKWVEKVFRSEVFPTLQPITVSKSKTLNLHPGLYLMVEAENPDKDQDYLSYIEIPEMIDRFIVVPEKHYTIDVIDLIQCNLKFMFKDRKIRNSYPISILRSAEVYNMIDGHLDPFSMIQATLKERSRAWITRVEVGTDSKHSLKEIKSMLPLCPDSIVLATDYVKLSDLKKFPSAVFEEKDRARKFKPYNTFPATSIFDYIKKEDRLAFHPYESYDSTMVRFLQEAANDPGVISIKISLYRVSNNSKIVDALLKAADKGKSVTVLIELKARFDEHHNMEVSTILREGGIRLVYTDPNIKTHAKVCIVTRKEKKGIRTYCQVGTGNYSESNSKQYTDYSYFTADEEIGYDLTRFFNLLCSDQGTFKSRKIIYAPYNMRDEIDEYIDRETKRAKKRKQARIICKCNSLTDDKIADKLIEAAKVGVKVTLIVRGACIIGCRKNLKVYSIVGRFLEHSRVYVFGNGKDADLLIGSADLMQRNLSNRNELLIRIEKDELKNRIMKHLKWYTDDNSFRRIIKEKYQYETVKPDKKEESFSVQDRCIKEAKKMALD